MGLERRGTYGTYSVCMVGNWADCAATSPTKSTQEDSSLAPAPAGQEAILDAVAALLAEAAGRGEALGIPEDVTEPEYRAFLTELLAETVRGDAGLAVAVRGDGEVIGTAQWRRSPYRTRRVLAELDRVAVVRHARGGGIGRALVEAIVAHAQQHGVELLSLEARGNNHGAVALYESLGFRRAGLLPNAVAVGRTRYDVLTMCRELERPAGLDLIGSLPAGAGASLPRGAAVSGDAALRASKTAARNSSRIPPAQLSTGPAAGCGDCTPCSLSPCTCRSRPVISAWRAEVRPADSASSRSSHTRPRFRSQPANLHELDGCPPRSRGTGARFSIQEIASTLTGHTPTGDRCCPARHQA